MAALLALVSAMGFGAGDFCGGLVSRRLPTSAVAIRTGSIGLVGLFVVALVVSGDGMVDHDVPLGVAGGLAGAVGILLLYRSLAVGTMSVVAPITALLAAIVPVAAGLASGERPSAVALAGVPLALVAIALLAWEPDLGADLRTTTPASVAAALIAGLGFGLFFVCLDATSDDAGLWPIVVARAAAVALFAIVTITAFVRRADRLARGAVWQGTTPWLLLAAGILDAGSNAVMLTATQHGLLTLVAVLASLYPASTLILARIVLGERLARLQQAGVGLAVVAVVLVAAG